MTTRADDPEATPRGPWVGIAANAHSGSGRGKRRVGRLAEALAARGIEARVAWTPEGRGELVASADRLGGCLGLVAAGGDGTVAAVCNERPRVPITVLPAGTENLFARHYGIDGRPERVAETIVGGRLARLDLGQVDGRRFSLMAGIGFDADVVTRHHAARLGPLGTMRPTNRAAYVQPVLRSSWSYRFPPLTILAEGIDGAVETLVGATAFLFNLPRYALGLRFAPSAREDDGWLDLVVFRDPGPFRALRYLWMVLRGLHLRRAGVYHRRVRRVDVTSAGDVPVQLDGDPGGMLAAPSWSAEVVPSAVEVLVPANYRR